MGVFKRAAETIDKIVREEIDEKREAESKRQDGQK